MKPEDRYPGLEHKGATLSAFAVAIDVFILSLKSGELVRFTPDDPKKFRQWLEAHQVRDADKKQGQDTAAALKSTRRRRLF
ncbi:hypothetical protein COR50_18175 [Chitinophaga caeni]|uniref:Uncharacterized protein n=1 Tax=Chitinophaga caeni TaxID=2029983 RepID=A0A291QY39_9BACT|nr:hypothetical protein [Chitinophaga caeni]ATL48939.1 hypothetical protein COR50_18175 [Chitinophaga caeni]